MQTQVESIEIPDLPTEPLIPIYIPRWACYLCGREYLSSPEAQICIDRGEEDVKVSVGDFVTNSYEGGQYGWFNGDKDWVIERKRTGADKDHWGKIGYDFIYVVTAITPETRPHTVRSDGWGLHKKLVHVATKGILNGPEWQVLNYSGGWTSRHHIRMKKIPIEKIPQKLIEESKPLIGLTFGLL